MSELYVVGDKLETRKKLPKKRINSNLLSVRIQHEAGIELKEPLTKPALLSLAHLHVRYLAFAVNSNIELWLLN